MTINGGVTPGESPENVLRPSNVAAYWSSFYEIDSPWLLDAAYTKVDVEEKGEDVDVQFDQVFAVAFAAGMKQMIDNDPLGLAVRRQNRKDKVSSMIYEPSNLADIHAALVNRCAEHCGGLLTAAAVCEILPPIQAKVFGIALLFSGFTLWAMKKFDN